MATRAQKEELMETLKFTPRNITITLSGYGGEIVMGKIDAKTARFWDKRDDLTEYANKWEDEDFSDIPPEFDFIEGNMWFELDNLAHSCGVEMSIGCWLTVKDELTGETLLEIELDPDTLGNAGIEASEFEDVSVDDRKPDEGVFVGQNCEKGLFFETEVEITRPFDPRLLSFNYSTYDGWRIFDSLTYDGQDVDGQDAYSTSGKSSSFEVYVDSEDVTEFECLEGEEMQAQRLIDESELGPWHATEDTNPVHIGLYDCQVCSTVWPDQQLTWNGEYWVMSTGEPMRLHVSAWRGLNHPPVDQ